MDRLWTPWRYSYITEPADKARKGVPQTLLHYAGFDTATPDLHCVFCNMIASVNYAIAHGMAPAEAEKAAFILLRGPHTYVCLNAFPYASGHVMVIPYLHRDTLADLPPEAAQELILTAQLLDRTLRDVYHPDGLNLGMNLGQAAGAGVADHLHLHQLPRWFGDTNFMTVIAESRILPETLDVTWTRLRKALESSKALDSSKAPTQLP